MLKSTFFKACRGAGLFILIMALCGCATSGRFYVPKPIPIKPGTVLKPDYKIVCSVSIINNQTNSQWVHIGDYTHTWSANLLMWTDTAVELLTDELVKRGVIISERSPKTLKLSITRAKLFWGFDAIGCTLNLNVITGDGYVVNIEETSSAKDLYESCDTAVSNAVAQMFQDRGIQDYLTTTKIFRDSDGDGVPNEIDACPDTPKGVKVDSRGCPLDSDGDGIPDYLDKCPDTPKGVEVDCDGCPLDSDGDGVPDYLDECPGTPRGVAVDGRGCPLDSDGDGVPDYRDKCPGTPKGVKVDSAGCPLDSDGDGVPDYRDACPGTPRGALVDERGCWVIGDTLFDFDKYVIKPQYYPLLDQVISVLKKNPSLHVEIEGHTDNFGSQAYNQILSHRRANAVMNYLIQGGIDKKRLSAVGYDFSRPRASNETEEGRALNRRVQFRPHQ
jgi:hypothetical protein